ncbi:AbiH family protein [Flagellimonas algicola]|uniref:Abortive infection AbiH-like protein n=1 Tax=Flagellimonas algicola TaxID=2583815 RepID=A0ABY2WJF0_9FLAO|nr:AbiH family protein [Allomuricauda algicola]TMU54969.1 hypothetical protein FGG15_12300 [Allomuricauda algicola]
MNKLIIVGNGFDLAHGLQTSYGHFINDFWSNLKSIYEEKHVQEIVYVNLEFYRVLTINSISCFEDLISNLEEYCEDHKFYFNKATLIATTRKGFGKEIFKFNNHLFKNLNLRSLENWVDIEYEYFTQLKTISKRKILSYTGSREEAEKEQISKNRSNAIQLNKEFNEIKELLKSYLIRNTADSYDLINGRVSNFQQLLNLLEVKPLYLSKTNSNRKFLNEFSIADHDEITDFDNKLIEASTNTKTHEFLYNSKKKTVFLNFNYTNSLYVYASIMKTGNYGYYLPPEIIPIHGSLKNEGDYEIFFGFGDEMDEDYSFIENLNQNEYLSHFKSFMYSRTPYYKQILDLIDSEKFQVYVMGHSCGLSDRTLLNTIFEHKNCRSIKVFYHKREDGTDNFTETIQNISRHFNDKKMMREKIVNKSLCSPLPQTMRFPLKNQ